MASEDTIRIVLPLIGHSCRPCRRRVIFMAHGAQKLFGAFGGPGLSAVVQMMGPLGYWSQAASSSAAWDSVFGFLSRFSAASIIVIMLGAVATVHGKFGFFMKLGWQPGGRGFEYHLLAIGALLPIVTPGRDASPSADSYLRLKLPARKGSQRFWSRIPARSAGLRPPPRREL